MTGISHIVHEHTYTDTESPYLPLLVVRPEDVHPFPVRLYGIALLLDAPLSGKELASLHALITGDRPFLLFLDSTIERNWSPEKLAQLHQASNICPSDNEPLVRFDSDVFEYITLCFFSPNYIRIGDTPVLAFHPSPPAGLITRLEQQGWPEIQQWNVSLFRRLTQRRQVPDIAGTLLTGTSAAASKYIFIHGKDLDDTLALEQDLHQHCGGILNSNPSLRSLILQKQQLQTALDNLEKEHRVLKERLGNTEATVRIIRSKYKDDYDILFNWYQQEYEVLPLWYKRFGHLIKVLTGRRTMKSLLQSIHRRLHRWKGSFGRKPPSGPPDHTPSPGNAPSTDPKKNAP